MVLNFGGNQLFPTELEDRWKGVFNERIEAFPSADSDESNAAINPGFSVLVGTPKITVTVGVDEKVFVCYTGVIGTNDTGSNSIFLTCKRNTTQLSAMNRSSKVENDSADTTRPGVAAATIDNPGEGVHTYELWGSTSASSSTLVEGSLTAFTLVVK